MANTDFNLRFSLSEQETISEARIAGCAVISNFFDWNIVSFSLYSLDVNNVLLCIL